MPERLVRFTEEFFDRLDSLLPEDRGDDGTPSVTDFLVFELPPLRDRLAADFEAYTMPTDDPDVRVYIGAGILVRTLAVFAAVGTGGSVEVFGLAIESAQD